MHPITQEIATTAAALIVEDGLAYDTAKRKAVKQMGLPPRTPLPSNEVVHEQVREYIALYCADTQPMELTTLRNLALKWMDRFAQLVPDAQVRITGAVWQGTATRLSDIYLQVFLDDSKTLEIALINQGVRYEVSESPGFRHSPVPALLMDVPCPEWQTRIGLHVSLHAPEDLRGAHLPHAQGQTPRGDATKLRQLINADNTAP